MPEIVIENGPQKGQRILLASPGPFVLGRDMGSAVTLVDPMVSRRHCRIECQKKGHVLLDMGSANGTFLNGTRREKHALGPGDRIKIGDTLLTFFPERVDDRLIGKTISGFEVLERIGQGGMGTVYRARQLSLDRFVAIKVLSRDLAASKQFAEAFHREARAAGQINHPSIVQVYDVDTVLIDGEEVTFFAMEFMQGGSVEDLINREKRIPQLRALEIALDTARGLEFAERHGMVHRDIKPGNLMVSENGMVKIGDLGIARHSETGDKVSQEGGISGSPHYIAPEQARGEDLDSGADMYSLGVSLYHILAGRPPFIGVNTRDLVLKHINDEPPDISKFRPDVDPGVKAALTRLMQKDRGNRYPDATSLVADFEKLTARLRAGGAGSQGERFTPMGRALFLAGLIVILLALGALVGVGINLYRVQARQTANNISSLRTDLETGLEELRALIVEEDLDGAHAMRAEIRTRLSADQEYAVHVNELITELELLEARITELEATLRDEQLREKAERALAAILEKLPARLADTDTPGELTELIAPLQELRAKFPETDAASTALERINGITSAREELVRELRRAREDFEALELRIKTYLDFDPPGYKSALAAIRAHATKYPRALHRDAAGRAAETVTRAMNEYVSKNIASLKKADDSNRAEAIRRLQRIRLEVEGDAVTRIDAALGQP